MIICKGRVEDKKLEAKAKAKDPKIRGQGQGQPFRRQTLPRPKTGILEANAKDQGHRRKCSPNQNKKFFQAISKKKVFKKVFASARVT